MVCDTYIERDSVVHRLDPRGRIVAASSFAVLVAAVPGALAPAGACAVSLAAAGAARLPVRATLKRLLPLNVLMSLLVVLLAVGAEGEALFRLGPVAFSRAGVGRGVIIALKANAIVLAATALVSTMELSALGHALSHLRVPRKLVHLLLLTVRYADVLHHEWARLHEAMRVRGFRPRLNRHTCRSYGYLVGMLLVRSFDRSERVAAAMACRGFSGRFFLLDHFALHRRDALFAAAAAAALAGVAVAGWL